MSLDPGTRLGPYEITGALGAGGMGTVYRARDTRLGRDVAIKALPEAHRADPERVARFRREAQILASLNHPHIAAIYGVEEAAGSQLLVLELVEGQTLADRLAAGPLHEDEALAIARQLADALHAAHEKGIIHRDLKPANVALTADGQAKVLDFGLGKALESEAPLVADGSPTRTSAPTEAGLILGTAAYMSPEQARGRPVDKRTDVWAFGCVLFEMLAGARAFPGATTSDALAAILEREPDWRLLPATIRPSMLRLLRRCLEKDPRRRLHDLADARIEIDDALAGPRVAEAVPAAAGRTSRERIGWLLATVVLAGLAAVLLVERQWRPSSAAAESRTYSVAVVLPENLQLWFEAAGRFSISPDGSRLALSGFDSSGRTRLWVRSLATDVIQPLPGTEDATYPFWSPDSRFIGFLSQGKLRRIDVSLGQVITLCEAGFPSMGAWTSDGTILFTLTGSSPLYRVSASGGTPVPATTLDSASGDVQHSYPFMLPDGRHFLYLVVGNKGNLTEARGVSVGTLDSQAPGTLVLPGVANAKYVDGHLVFVRGGTLLAQRFDLNRLALVGEAAPIVEQVQVSGGSTTTLVAGFSVSQNSVLAFQTGGSVRTELAWFNRAGAQTGTLGRPADHLDVALSPDGGRAAVSILDPAVGTRDVWVYDVARNIGDRFTSDPSDDFAPNWVRPDGSRIVFTSRRQGTVHLYEKAASGAGQESLLWADGLGKFNANSSPDGRFFVYVAGGSIIGRSELWVLQRGGKDTESKASAYLTMPYIKTQPQFSPDGRWIAYTSRESGSSEVYVSSFPDAGHKMRISSAGGSLPRWNRNGREMFYVRPDSTLMAVDVDGEGQDFRPFAERVLFPIPLRPLSRLDAFPYDVHPDGQRFLVNRPAQDVQPAVITLLINWKGNASK